MGDSLFKEGDLGDSIFKEGDLGDSLFKEGDLGDSLFQDEEGKLTITYSRVPNNRPSPPLINFSKIFQSPPPLLFQPPLLLVF